MLVIIIDNIIDNILLIDNIIELTNLLLNYYHQIDITHRWY